MGEQISDPTQNAIELNNNSTIKEAVYNSLFCYAKKNCNSDVEFFLIYCF